MTEKISNWLRTGIKEGRLELFFNDQEKFIPCFSGELNVPQEMTVFEGRPNIVKVGNHVFKKTFEKKYFPTINGLEAERQIIEVNYEVIK